MLVRILFLVLAVAAALVHGYRFRHIRKRLVALEQGLATWDGHLSPDMQADPRNRPRQKRVSDQRLAELETLVALSNMKGNIKTIPYGFGSVDPNKAGRRRRSPGALLDRLIDTIAREEEDEGSSPPQDRPVVQWPPYFWQDQQQSE